MTKIARRGAPQAFPKKLFEIVSVEDDEIIGWSPSGEGFFLKNPKIFIEKILQKYFRHQNYSSFQRQLNLYGFRKITKGPEIGAYSHDSFRRGHPDLLLSIKRAPQWSAAKHRKRELKLAASRDIVNSSPKSRTPKRHMPRKTSIRSRAKQTCPKKEGAAQNSTPASRFSIPKLEKPVMFEENPSKQSPEISPRDETEKVNTEKHVSNEYKYHIPEMPNLFKSQKSFDEHWWSEGVVGDYSVDMDLSSPGTPDFLGRSHDEAYAEDDNHGRVPSDLVGADVNSPSLLGGSGGFVSDDYNNEEYHPSTRPPRLSCESVTSVLDEIPAMQAISENVDATDGRDEGRDAKRPIVPQLVPSYSEVGCLPDLQRTPSFQEFHTGSCNSNTFMEAEDTKKSHFFHNSIAMCG